VPEAIVIGGAFHLANEGEREVREIVRRERAIPNSWTMKGLHAAIGALFLVTGCVALSGCQRHAVESQSQIADGVRFEYGAVPSSVPTEHPTDHLEASMHGGAPRVENSYHVVLAIFDKSSGRRITDASVVMRTSGPGQPGDVETLLGPMPMNGDMSYGGYIALPDAAKYRLTFKVSRPGLSGAAAAFLFDRPE
jgi:hypothetical protein